MSDAEFAGMVADRIVDEEARYRLALELTRGLPDWRQRLIKRTIVRRDWAVAVGRVSKKPWGEMTSGEARERAMKGAVVKAELKAWRAEQRAAGVTEEEIARKDLERKREKGRASAKVDNARRKERRLRAREERHG